MKFTCLFSFTIQFLSNCDNLFISDSVNCGGNRSGLFGLIQTPNFPNTYPNNLHCVWNITVPKGHRIRIRFTVLDIEYFFQCDYDWISLLSGNSTLGRFCGSKHKTTNTHYRRLPQEYIISPTNQCILTFHSDYSNEEAYSGFRAHYIAVGKLIQAGNQLVPHSFIYSFIHSSVLLFILLSIRSSVPLLYVFVCGKTKNDIFDFFWYVSVFYFQLVAYLISLFSFLLKRFYPNLFTVFRPGIVHYASHASEQ